MKSVDSGTVALWHCGTVALWQIPEGEGDEVDQAADLRGQCGQPVGVQVQLGQVAQLPGQVQVQCRYSAGTVQVQYRYSTGTARSGDSAPWTGVGTVQVQYRYNSVRWLNSLDRCKGVFTVQGCARRACNECVYCGST